MAYYMAPFYQQYSYTNDLFALHFNSGIGYFTLDRLMITQPNGIFPLTASVCHKIKLNPCWKRLASDDGTEDPSGTTYFTAYLRARLSELTIWPSEYPEQRAEVLYPISDALSFTDFKGE